MPQAPIPICVHVTMDAEVEDIHELAADITELAEMVPEWNQMEAQELVDRIGVRVGNWIKARQVKS